MVLATVREAMVRVQRAFDKPMLSVCMPGEIQQELIEFFETIARLKPGMTIAQAEAEGTSYASSVDRPLADLVFGTGAPVEVRVRSLVDQMTMRVRQTSITS